MVRIARLKSRILSETMINECQTIQTLFNKNLPTQLSTPRIISPSCYTQLRVLQTQELTHSPLNETNFWPKLTWPRNLLKTRSRLVGSLRKIIRSAKYTATTIRGIWCLRSERNPLTNIYKSRPLILSKSRKSCKDLAFVNQPGPSSRSLIKLRHQGWFHVAIPSKAW